MNVKFIITSTFTTALWACSGLIVRITTELELNPSHSLTRLWPQWLVLHFSKIRFKQLIVLVIELWLHSPCNGRGFTVIFSPLQNATFALDLGKNLDSMSLKKKVYCNCWIKSKLLMFILQRFVWNLSESTNDKWFTPWIGGNFSQLLQMATWVDSVPILVTLVQYPNSTCCLTKWLVVYSNKTDSLCSVVFCCSLGGME